MTERSKIWMFFIPRAFLRNNRKCVCLWSKRSRVEFDKVPWTGSYLKQVLPFARMQSEGELTETDGDHLARDCPDFLSIGPS